MRITKVNIPKNLINNGLETVEMHKMGQIVLLAGKNGSGKSRLLNLISQTISQKPIKGHKEKAEKDIEIYNNAITEQTEALKVNHQNLAKSEGENRVNIEREIERIENDLKSYKLELKKKLEIFNWDLIETDTIEDSYTIVPFIPKSLDLKDSNDFNRNQVKSNAKNVDLVGVDSLANGTFARIQLVQERFFNATHQNSNVPQIEKDEAIAEYEKLKQLIHIFMNTELDRNIDSESTIFGFPLGQSNLSDGQKVLIQLCLAIHCQSKALDKLILFLDEPENHLHPSVIVETIERVIKYIPNGQIWISTHSIPLLASFDPSNIWFLEDGKVAYAGTVPENVLTSLLGNEHQISKLQDFISLPGILALNRHAYESLFHPESVLTGKDDLQGLQIRDEIKNCLKEQNKIRIIDYGAGKGRLLANIIENNQDPVASLIENLDYVAFDQFEYDKDECISVLQKIYPDFKNRYFNDFNTLFSTYDKKSFDVVIMCNVLHEIDPNEWLNLFSKDGQVSSLLSENGILLVVEDQEMLIGEKAYQKGFVVLDTPEIKEVFNITERDTDFGYSTVKEGRLKAHRIKKEYLGRITSETRINCLKSLNKKAATNILKIRDEEIDYKNGKKHGFWIQQLANTTLCLNELTNN
jgi:ABC-type multidrug transport system ATPase subunit